MNCILIYSGILLILASSIHSSAVQQCPGTNACSNVQRADTGARVSCPLDAGREYLYTISIPVEKYYPRTSLRVRWALTDAYRDVICFEIPATITPPARTS
ncbi:unnamed protein product [Leptidea sinapis]|uniref:MD-2-related lipid-recognition domain-containing protein n=1 Tax=Leptidea sinapis TaxID=189913 RepID=A0A5E4Q351_9NEOP|nr:unnamed protein product [Leptidea sinapis]